jgi:hypothetical protein
VTEAEYQELMGLYGPQRNLQKKKKAVEQSAVAGSSITDVFASAAKEILDDAGGYLAKSAFGRGGMLDISQYVDTRPAITGLQALQSGVAGFASTPREIPRLAEAGYEYATGEDVDFDVLAGTGFPTYQEAGEFIGGYTGLPTELREDASAAEKAMYYGIESLPMFGGGGLRGLAMRTAQGSAAGFGAEVNPALGMAIGAAPELPLTPSIPGASRKGFKETRMDALDSDAQRMAEQSLSDFGIEETRGQILYRQALAETNQRRRTTKLAEAERVLGLEEAGRRVDARKLSPGVRSNVELWKDADIKQAKQIENAMRKIVGAAEGRKKPADVSRKLANIYNGWSKKRMQKLRKENKADFDSLDPSIRFDLEFLLPEIDNLMEYYGLAKRVDNRPANTIMKIREQILTEQGKLRKLSPKEYQNILSDLGRIAWSGRIEGVADLDPGTIKTVAAKMQQIFKRGLDSMAESDIPDAQKLKDVRDRVAGRFAALEDETSGPLMEFFKFDAAPRTPLEIVEALEYSATDPDKIKIFASLVQQEHPTLWPEVKQALFNREMAKLADTEGNLDIIKLRQAKENLLQNELLFGDGSASQGLEEMDRLFTMMEGIFKRIDPADLSSTDLYKAMKLGSEIGGSLGGPKARYVSEAATKLAMLAKGGRLPVEAAAEFASNPKARKVMVKILKGEAATLTPAEMGILKNIVRLGKIQTFAGLPSIYFGRDEDAKQSIEDATKAVQGMFSGTKE